MVHLNRIVLDILKPHRPDVLDFARRLAGCGADYRVQVTVIEMDEKTETLRVVVEGTDIDMARLRDAIADIGGSLHSIDEVDVRAAGDEG